MVIVAQDTKKLQHITQKLLFKGLLFFVTQLKLQFLKSSNTLILGLNKTFSCKTK